MVEVLTTLHPIEGAKGLPTGEESGVTGWS